VATSRRRVAGLVATAITVPFLFPAAASANAQFGQSEEPVPPPAPSACHGYLWTNTGGTILSAKNPRIVIPGLVKPAGIIDITEVITYDLREDGPTAVPLGVGALASPAADPEKYEKMRIEFWKGDTMLGATPTYTPDLLDEGIASWVRTPLGRTDIFEDADRVEIVHASAFMATDTAPNAFTPVSVCITWREHYTENSAALATSCNSATITMTNNGTAKGHVRVIANGTSTDYLVKPYGGAQTHQRSLGEDTWTDVKVIDLDTNAVLLEKKWLTDCVPPVTTTTTKTVVLPPTPEVEPQVLGIQATAPAQAQLARTGSQTTTNATIGATLLAFGLGLVTLGRRRKAQA
jgi:LPXTG-motif cell wall-anchored protein